MMEGAIPWQRQCAPSPRSSRGEGWGEGLSRVARLAESVRRVGKAAGSRECANRWRAHQFKNHLKQEVGNGAKSAFCLTLRIQHRRIQHRQIQHRNLDAPVSAPVLTGLNREKGVVFRDTTFAIERKALLFGTAARPGRSSSGILGRPVKPGDDRFAQWPAEAAIRR